MVAVREPHYGTVKVISLLAPFDLTHQLQSNHFGAHRSEEQEKEKRGHFASIKILACFYNDGKFCESFLGMPK